MADQDFEWVAEEEQVPLSRRTDEQNTAAGWWGMLRRRPVIIFLLLAVLASGLYWAFQRYYGDPALAKEEVQATHLLVREAVLLEDEGQFSRLLSDEDETWATAQQALVADQAWFRRGGLGLHWQRTLSPATTVTFTNGTDTAEIVTAETYTRTLADGRAQQVTLYQTAHYRPVAEGWLLAPPDNAFWGEQQVIEESHLRLLYPARDAALAQRLAVDLNELVQRVCGNPELEGCPVRYRLGVELSTDPVTLGHMDPAILSLRLPTPTLAGLPASEAAYTALVEGYSREVVGAAVADLVGWECCLGGAFFEALVEVQRQELGLPVPDLLPADYGRLVREKVEPGDLYGLWALHPGGLQSLTRNRVRAVVGFMREWEPETTVAEWLRRLVAAGDYREWAGEVAEAQMTFRMRAAWLGYLHSHAGLADNETQSLPEEDILLLCYDAAERVPDFTAGQWLLRYDPEREELRPESPEPLSPGALLLAQTDNDLVVAEGLLPQRPTMLLSGLAERRLEMSVAGEETEPLFEASFGEGLSWVQPSPQGNYLFVGVYNPSANASAIHLLDVVACRQGNCEMTWLADVNSLTAAWSPDEQHFLWQQADGLYVAAVDDLEARKVGPVPDSGYYELLWLDNETYGYFHFQNSDPAARPHDWIEPIVATVDDPRLGLLYNAEDLLSLLPEYEEAPGRATLILNPADADQPYIVLEFWGASTSHVLSFNRSTREARPLLELDPNAAFSLVPSPDGRWLAYGGADQLFVYDTLRGRVLALDTFIQLSQLRWTPDSEWLLGLGENTLAVAAPQTGHLQLKIDAQLNCTQAVWAAEQE